MESTIEGPPTLLEFVSQGGNMAGIRNIEFQYDRLGRELPRALLGVLHPIAGTGEDDLGTFLLGERSNAETDRCFGEHSGDEQTFAFEKSHGSSYGCPRTIGVA